MSNYLTVDQYLGQHLAGHESELTGQIRENAALTVSRANLFLAEAVTAGVPLVGNLLASGWRPAGVNAATANSAKASKHMIGLGLDIRDDAHRSLCRWAVTPAGREALDRIGLWCERPQWTPTWLHVQPVAPKSGNRFFVPSSAPAMVPPLPGELA